MELVNEIKQRLELALRLEEPPTIEEVLEQASRHGVLRGPVDWVFPAWMTYIEYVTQEIIKTFQLSEEERTQLLDFRDAMKRLLLEAWTQAKEKLTSLYKAVVEGTCRLEEKRLYAPDGTWMYVNETMRISIYSVSAVMHFPDVLKLPQEKLELFQLGWRASDEYEKNGRPGMSTTQPWQAFAWTAVRYGELYVRIVSANLTREGVSIMMRIIARSWKQKWGKNEAIDLIASHFRNGEWSPILTTWLGDGGAERKRALRGDYVLTIVSKEPWRLGKRVGAEKVLVATGKEAFVKLRKAAGVYGELLDLLRAHKWIIVKLAADDSFRTAYKLNRKRSIDILRETYKHNNSEIPTEQFSETDIQRRDAIVVAGVVMYLHLRNNRGGSLMARRYVRNVEKALAIAERLESAGLRPNVIPAGSYYMVYIATADLLKLAKRDEVIRKTIALYLAEKAKNGTPRESEAAEKILKRHPFFSHPLNCCVLAYNNPTAICSWRRLHGSETQFAFSRNRSAANLSPEGAATRQLMPPMAASTQLVVRAVALMLTNELQRRRPSAV